MNSTSFINKPSTFVGGQSFNILIQEYFVSEEWEWIYQFSLQKKTTEEKLISCVLIASLEYLKG